MLVGTFVHILTLSWKVLEGVGLKNFKLANCILFFFPSLSYYKHFMA